MCSRRPSATNLDPSPSPNPNPNPNSNPNPNVLKAAKRNELRQTRRLMEKDEPARAALAKARPELQKVFDAACAKYSRRERCVPQVERG